MLQIISNSNQIGALHTSLQDVSKPSTFELLILKKQQYEQNQFIKRMGR
jgi:hypothetical protein